MTPTEKRIIAAARTIQHMLELGDQRLLAMDGPVGNMLPALSPGEWGKVYRACKRIVACAADAKAKAKKGKVRK